jgi:hypothetical protein
MRNIVHNKMRITKLTGLNIQETIGSFYAVQVEADAWLLQNLEKDSYKSYSTFWEFVSEEDALIFKLRFGL